ncbi:MAG: metal transporter, partial [Candidatus Hecatellales archaeon]
MHIPDGFLDPTTAVITYLALIVYGGLAVKMAKKTF